MGVVENNERIAKNTIFLFFRMLLLLFVGLYTSRVVLSTLGISDYGLYNVVGGVVTMLGFLNGSLAGSTQRFLNISLGKKDRERVKLIFSNALLLHVLLALLVLIVAETIGLWFVLNKMNIPSGREMAALCCYQFSIFASLVGILQLPFMACILAHEDMRIYAYVSLFDAFAKLAVCYLIQISSYDKLISYSFMILVVSLISSVGYMGFCKKTYKEASFCVVYNAPIFRDLLGFGGWNIIGNLAYSCNNYGLNIIFNIFFGTIINAARGVSYQINGILQQFSSNFQVAVKPQVIKYYAEGNFSEMEKLVFNSAKYSALLMMLLSIPVALEIEYILEIWLGEYPDYTPIFLRLILFQTVVTSMIGPVLMVVHASGYLKAISITAGLLNLSLLPINFILFKFNCPPETALIVNITGSFLETFIELKWMKHYIDFPIGDFYRKVYLPVFSIGLLMLCVPLLLHLFLPVQNSFYKFIIVSFASAVTSLVVLWKWGIDGLKRVKIKLKVSNLLNIRL